MIVRNLYMICTMGFLIEFVGEILLEGSFGIIKNKKKSIWIRIPFMITITLFYLMILALITYVAMLMLPKNKLLALISFLIDILVIVGIISYSFKKKEQ